MEKSQQSQKEIKKAANELAKLLGETAVIPKEQIFKLIEMYGIEWVRTCYDEALVVESQGGLMLTDNSRRRTLGGVFFYLARKKMDPERLRDIFPGPFWVSKANQKSPSVPLLMWTDRIAIIDKLRTSQGEVASMKITLSGRPGQVEVRPEIVVTTMSYVAQMPNQPHGMPSPPETPTLYTIYMTPKQWNWVEKAIADPDDKLLIDGVCAFDPDVNGMAVFVSAVTTEHLIELQRQTHKTARVEKQKPAQEAKQASKAAQPPKQGRSAPAAAPPSVRTNTPAAAPRSGKLDELYASASVFRQKIADITAKPPGQQFGLEMTRKLLKNIEDEIAALEKKQEHTST